MIQSVCLCNVKLLTNKKIKKSLDPGNGFGTDVYSRIKGLIPVHLGGSKPV